MLIRAVQMQVFEKAAIQRFEDEMVEHLWEFTPKHSEVLGEEGLRRAIRLCSDKARKYGLTDRGPVRFYIQLSFMFGMDFDTDPQLPWADEALNDKMLTDQFMRADCLYVKMMQYISAAAGSDYEYAKEALDRVQQLRLEDLPLPGGNFMNEMVARLKNIYPQKCEYVGEARIRLLVQRAVAASRKYGVSAGAGDALFAGLMFALGHGFATDPRLPSITATLDETDTVDPHQRVRRLYLAMMSYLEKARLDYERVLKICA